ncbi:MAG TPA: hypothetical protein VFO83_16135 [Aggregicoccus sp.]|nr:hypothetical protein [Aggregicoccus sp.]
MALALLASGTGAEASRQGDLNVFVKGGLGDYTGGLGDFSSLGPSWGATLNFQPYSFLGVELGYEGSRNVVDDNRFLEGSAPSLLRHGGASLIKLSPPFLEEVRPFIGVGLGASYVSVSGEANGLYESDFMEEVPMAAGLEFNYGAFTAGVRATYRLLLNEQFADAALVEEGPSGGLFDAALTLGGRF